MIVKEKVENRDLDQLLSSAACCSQPSAIREICKLINRPGMRSLAGGWPDPNVFPGKEIAAIAKGLLEMNAGVVLQYGTTEGLLELRTQLADWAGEKESIQCAQDDILITHGSAQAMDLACRILLDPGDVVLVELPTYFGGVGAIRSCGAEAVGVELDQDGLDPDHLEKQLKQQKKQRRRVKGVYVIPNFQNPTGATLSLERRKQLLALADKYHFMILEDDPYSDLRFEGQKIPSLRALDRSDRVIHMRSFSKIFTPGMRLGWVTGKPDFIRKMVVAKQFVDCATNTLSQHILLEFIRSGRLSERIIGNNKHYCAKRDFMLSEMEKHFPKAVTWNRPQGGFFIFVHLPEHLNADQLLREAIERNVAFVAGSAFFINDQGQNTLRLSYSQAGLSEIEAAIAEIGLLIKRKLTYDIGMKKQVEFNDMNPPTKHT
jgi:2-aminoadipate transaminase